MFWLNVATKLVTDDSHRTFNQGPANTNQERLIKQEGTGDKTQRLKTDSDLQSQEKVISTRSIQEKRFGER